MRNQITFIWAFITLAASGADLHLQDGTVLKNARLSQREGDAVTIFHSSGGGSFKLSEFTTESQSWFEGKHGSRSFGGMHLVTDEQYRLAKELIELASDGPRFKAAIISRLDQSAGSSTITVRIRKEILCRLHATELTEEELKVIVGHMKSPLLRKARSLEQEYMPKIEKIVGDHIEKHPEFFDAFKKRLEGKSKRTGLFYIELDKIASEIVTTLQPEITQVLQRYFTPEEIEQCNQLENTPAFKRLDKISMMAELIIPNIVSQYITEKPDDLKTLIELILKEGEHKHTDAQQTPAGDVLKAAPEK